MSEHKKLDLAEAVEKNIKISFPVEQSNKSRLSGKIRYWWCWAVASSMLLFIALPVLPILWIIGRREWFYPLALWGAEHWVKAAGAKVVVRGTENLDPDRSYVFISNHRSYLDTTALFRYAGKRIGLVAKKELLKVPVLGQGMHFVNIFAIDRSNPEKARQSIEKAKQAMDRGYSFGVFAEGTRAMPGDLLPFKKGAFHLAIQTGAQIIPVAIKNTDVIMGKKTGVAYPGTIEIVLMPPIKSEGRSMDELITLVRGEVAKELAA